MLVDIDQRVENPAPSQSEVFEDYVHFTERESVDGGAFELIYTAKEDSRLIVEIYDGKKVVARDSSDALSGFGTDTYVVDTKLNSGTEYTAVVYLVKSGSESTKGYLSGDSFSFTTH